MEPFPEFNFVDLPRALEIHKATSRKYFARMASGRFGLIFLDGLHTYTETHLHLQDALSKSPLSSDEANTVRVPVWRHSPNVSVM